jgi:HEAT repeat protein
VLDLVVAVLVLIAISALVYAFIFAGGPSSDDKLNENHLVETFRSRLKHTDGLVSAPIGGLIKRLEGTLSEEQTFYVDAHLGGLQRGGDYPEVLDEVHNRRVDDVLPFAEAWSRDADPVKRAAAADLVGGRRDATLRPATLNAVAGLATRLTADPDRRVVMTGLGALRDRFGGVYPEQLLARVRASCTAHSDEIVRHAFLDILFPGAPETAQGQAVAIAMSQDASPLVRREACFKLGSLSVIASQDSPELRTALVARLDDPEVDVRAFAIEGLALRNDQRAIPALARDLVLCDEAWAVTAKGIKVDGLSDADKQAVVAEFQLAMKSNSSMQQLMSAAGSLPDSRLIPGLEALAGRFPMYRPVLMACRARSTASKIVGSVWGKTPEAAAQNPLADPKILADRKLLAAALPKASTQDLLITQALPQTTDNPSATAAIWEECKGRPPADVIAAARTLARDSDPAKRAAAAKALVIVIFFHAPGDGAPPNRSITDLLLTLAGDGEKSVVLAALDALLHQLRMQEPFDAKVAARLRAFETHPDVEVREAYGKIFERGDWSGLDQGLFDIWLRLIKDPSPRIRKQACGYFHYCMFVPYTATRDDVRQALRQCLSDEDLGCRMEALQVLCKMKDRTTAAAIEQELQRLLPATETLPLDDMLNTITLLTDAINDQPNRRYVPTLTRLSERVLARLGREVGVNANAIEYPDEFEGYSQEMAERLANVIQSCKSS